MLNTYIKVNNVEEAEKAIAYYESLGFHNGIKTNQYGYRSLHLKNQKEPHYVVCKIFNIVNEASIRLLSSWEAEMFINSSVHPMKVIEIPTLETNPHRDPILGNIKEVEKNSFGVEMIGENAEVK
jgi:hypothetical protein